jgi:hypothetical protein
MKLVGIMRISQSIPELNTVIRGKLLEFLSDYQLLKEDTFLCSYLVSLGSVSSFISVIFSEFISYLRLAFKDFSGFRKQKQ